MKKYLIVGVAVIASLFLGAYFAFIGTQVSASVAIGNEYHSTTTTSTSASSTKAWNAFSRSGVLGSIIMSSSSPVTTYPPITIYDASSTMATATSRVVAKFGVGNQTHGTYQYDLNVFYGLTIETPAGFNGIYTITYR